jgi:(S)-2-hydroxyglutarate dehydrogenase
MAGSQHYDVLIIGGGIVGFSTAMQLIQRDDRLRVAVLEKESALGQHQTGHNSGVIHAGVYYPPGSMKAKFCIAGCQATKAFCQTHDIPFKVTGKLITATNQQELIWMEALIARCLQNGLTPERLDAQVVEKMQPGLKSAGGFFVKETGIVNWQAVCKKYAEIFERHGGHILYEAAVSGIDESRQAVKVSTRKGDIYTSDYVISCCGLYADRIVRMSGLKPTFKIVPFRGEYFILAPEYNQQIQMPIYPVPNPALPFLGVHFTPQINGRVTVGPSAVLALAREGYSWKNINARDVLENLMYWPVWKLMLDHWKVTAEQFFSSVFKGYYIKTAQRYFPEIRRQAYGRFPAGVRAQAIDRHGRFIKDFLFMTSERCLHTCNAPSPAATSSLPIGQHIVEQFFDKMKIKS